MSKEKNIYMKIEKNKVVSLTYTLRKDNKDGEILEVCKETKPLEFVFDSGLMLAHFEKNILGLAASDTFEFTLNPDEAYGQINESAIVDVNKDIFIIDGVLREDLLQIGNIVPMRDSSGHPLNGKITKVDDAENIVIIDFNHPLAGENLHFTGKIESIREATAEELAYGIGGKSCGCGSGGCSSDSCGSDDDDCCGSSAEGGGCGSCGCGH